MYVHQVYNDFALHIGQADYQIRSLPRHIKNPRIPEEGGGWGGRRVSRSRNQVANVSCRISKYPTEKSETVYRVRQAKEYYGLGAGNAGESSESKQCCKQRIYTHALRQIFSANTEGIICKP